MVSLRYLPSLDGVSMQQSDALLGKRPLTRVYVKYMTVLLRQNRSSPFQGGWS